MFLPFWLEQNTCAVRATKYKLCHLSDAACELNTHIFVFIPFEETAKLFSLTCHTVLVKVATVAFPDSIGCRDRPLPPEGGARSQRQDVQEGRHCSSTFATSKLLHGRGIGQSIYSFLQWIFIDVVCARCCAMVRIQGIQCVVLAISELTVTWRESWTKIMQLILEEGTWVFLIFLFSFLSPFFMFYKKTVGSAIVFHLKSQFQM